MPAYTDPAQGKNAMHRLLLELAPRNDQGNLSITKLGERINRSRGTIHSYITDEKIDPKTAKELVEFAKNEGLTIPDPNTGARRPLTLQDMEAFVYNV